MGKIKRQPRARRQKAVPDVDHLATCMMRASAGVISGSSLDIYGKDVMRFLSHANPRLADAWRAMALAAIKELS